MQSDKRLGDFFRKRSQKGTPGLPLLSVTMKNGLVHRDTLDRKMDTNLTDEDHLLIKKGDIAYNMMRMWQGASGLAHWDGMVSPAYVVVAPKNGIDPLFASYWFKSPRMIYLFWAYSYGLTKDRLRLYFNDFAKVPAEPPALSEQKRIAATLRTCDQAIEQTEKLIRAKQRFKHGLMQELLTGNRRFPGFADQWRQFSFSDIASLGKKRSEPNSNDTHVPCVELEHIAQVDGRLLGTTDARKQRSTKAVFRRGDVLFGKLRPNLRKYVHCTFDGVCSTEIWVLKVNRKICCSEYLFRLVQTERFISAACRTAGSKMPRAEWSYVSQQVVRLPSVPEQRKIATALDIIDQQVSGLSALTECLRRQKAGLMHQLSDHTNLQGATS